MEIEVAIPTPLNQTFTYLSDVDVAKGSRIQVPFGPRKVLGVVTAGVPADAPEEDEEELLSLTVELEDEPLEEIDEPLEIEVDALSAAGDGATPRMAALPIWLLGKNSCSSSHARKSASSGAACSARAARRRSEEDFFVARSTSYSLLITASTSCCNCGSSVSRSGAT